MAYQGMNAFIKTDEVCYWPSTGIFRVIQVEERRGVTYPCTLKGHGHDLGQFFYFFLLFTML